MMWSRVSSQWSVVSGPWPEAVYLERLKADSSWLINVISQWSLVEDAP